jgi:GAF domain-containing protein
MSAEGAAGAWARTLAATDTAMAQIGLVDAPEHDGLARLARLAADMIGAPIALVSVVQPALDRQFLSATHGVDGPLAAARKTDMAYSFCRHVRERGRALIVTDASKNPLVLDNPSVAEFNIHAYLGVPIHWPDGTTIGALCVIDGVPRGWTASDLERLGHLARCVDDQIRLLLALYDKRAALTRAELAATARDLMLREVNHELRTPLNGVVGAAEILSESVLDEEQGRFVDLLIDSAEQLTRIVEEVASLTSDLTGPRAGHAETFDPVALLGEVIALLSHRSTACALQEPRNGGCFRIRTGDKLMLRHVLYDAVRTATTAWPSATIGISVDDCSPDVLGITLRSRPRISGRTLPAPRSGRALAAELRVARSVVRAMGGSLRLELMHAGDPEATISLRLPFPEAPACSPTADGMV